MNANDTVLLVEDNDDEAELLLRSFQKHRLDNPIVIARNGQEALDYLFCEGAYQGRDRLDLPILILLDLKLPKVDGLEVLRQVRAREVTRCIPIVILTTSSQPRDKLESYAGGVNSYVRKPVDFDQFVEVTRVLGNYWLKINDPPPVGDRERT